MLAYIQNLDVSILLWIQNHIRHSYLNGFVRAITFMGDYGWFWIFLTLFLLFMKKNRKAGISMASALLLEALVTNVILKNLVARVRPYDYTSSIILLVQKQSDYSFPSGHTAASFACACTALWVLPKKYSIPLMILAILIALSRLYVGVHYPTDVIGGIIIGIASAFLARVIVNGIKGKK